jgi:membrane protein DedA with SNARE-associated domain
MPEPLSFLGVLRGAPSLVIACGLLFLEEAGLPIPIAPGEAVLIGCGLLIATGAVPFWVVLPAAYASVLAGCLVGYLWSRAVGPDRLVAVVGRLGAAEAFERVAQRLRGAGPGRIAASRLVPGLRVYTTLVGGAVGVPGRRFIAAVAPAIAVWLLVFTLLGVFVGVPAQRFLGRFENLAIRVALVLVLLAAAYLGLRRVPSVGRVRVTTRPASGWRLAVALAIDLGVVAVVTGVLGVLTGLADAEPESVVSTLFMVGTLSLVYLVVARRSAGLTAGETILRVRYP